MKLFLIILLGVFLRLSYIIKPEGLWNDEYVSWAVASTPFGSGFLQEILQQCHMPIYYLYLKCFGNSEILLRLSSVLPSVISIYVMYKIGALKDKTVANTLAVITSVLSFLIYYSQEVRFYSLLFLFSTLSLYFMLKYLKHGNKKNLIGYIFSSLLILFTHTIGFVYVFFTFLYLLNKTRGKKALFIAGMISIMAALPLVAYISSHVGTSQWWGIFSYRNLIFMITDFFSPVLTNNVNIPGYLIYKTEPLFIIKLFLPAILALNIILHAVYKNQELRELFFITLGTTSILTLAAITGKFVFITKYNIEILPILLYIFAYGLSVNKNIFKTTVLTTWLIFQISNFTQSDYVTKIPRLEGNRIPIVLLKQNNLAPDDKIIFTYYNSDRFSKYINLNDFDVSSIDKAKTSEIVTDNFALTEPEYISSRIHIQDSIRNYVKPNKRTFVVFLNSVTFFSDKILNDYVSRNDAIKTIHPMYIESSVLKNEFVKYGKNNNLDVKFSGMGSWTLLIIERSK